MICVDALIPTPTLTAVEQLLTARNKVSSELILLGQFAVSATRGAMMDKSLSVQRFMSAP
jgi:hypothetical protein